MFETSKSDDEESFLTKISLARDDSITLSRRDKIAATNTGLFVILQCLVVFGLAYTVLACVWKQELASSYFDFDTLARIMYLYDAKACGAMERIKMQEFTEIILPNENTHGFKVKPIQSTKAVSLINTKLSDSTRSYIKTSVYLHVLWLVASVGFIVVIRTRTFKWIRMALAWYFYSFIFMFIFDISMGILYMAHIQQAITKIMIIRLSGWIGIKLKSPEDFAGWLPMAASACWMRGILIFLLNIYCCRLVSRMRKRICRLEVKMRLQHKGFKPIPDPNINRNDDATLLYRSGDDFPTFSNNWNLPVVGGYGIYDQKNVGL